MEERLQSSEITKKEIHNESHTFVQTLMKTLVQTLVQQVLHFGTSIVHLIQKDMKILSLRQYVAKTIIRRVL